jgi:hypothetical protein
MQRHEQQLFSLIYREPHEQIYRGIYREPHEQIYREQFYYEIYDIYEI